MKIMTIADLHNRSTNILKRKDNYEKTLNSKMDEIFNVFCKDVDVICFPGDIFDSFRASNKTMRKMIKRLSILNQTILGVWGQHDLQFRDTDLDKLPIGMLEAANCITLLNSDPISIDDCDFYGANFEEDIPEIIDGKRFNVLVIHDMIIDTKLWKQQENYKTSRAMLRDHNFDLILSGDNHQSFDTTFKGKTLINGGCIMRNKINLSDHKPRVVIFDTETRGIENKFLTIAPFNDIFNVEEYEKEVESNKSLEELEEILNTKNEINADFKETCLADSIDESKEVKDIIGEAFGEE